MVQPQYTHQSWIRQWNIIIINFIISFGADNKSYHNYQFKSNKNVYLVRLTQRKKILDENV